MPFFSRVYDSTTIEGNDYEGEPPSCHFESSKMPKRHQCVEGPSLSFLKTEPVLAAPLT